MSGKRYGESKKASIFFADGTQALKTGMSWSAIASDALSPVYLSLKLLGMCQDLEIIGNTIGNVTGKKATTNSHAASIIDPFAVHCFSTRLSATSNSSQSPFTSNRGRLYNRQAVHVELSHSLHRYLLVLCCIEA